MSEELWIEIHNIVRKSVTKIILKKKKCKKAEWLLEEALHVAEERREVKGKGEMERYTQLNAKVQRTARRDQKAFLNEQCKEIEESNRMGKTRDLFKKTGDIIGKFHTKMGTLKDRNSKYLTEAEEIKKGGKNIQKNYSKKGLNNSDNHNGVVTHLE